MKLGQEWRIPGWALAQWLPTPGGPDKADVDDDLPFNLVVDLRELVAGDGAR